MLATSMLQGSVAKVQHRFAARAVAPAAARRVPACHARRSRRAVAVRASAEPVALIAAAEGLQRALQPQADFFNSLGLPAALSVWGHPGNMAIVLFGVGGYGALYLGWQIRLSEDGDVVAMAKDAHPKMSLIMLLAFAIGAFGGLLSLTMQGKPIFESTHVWTGLAGLTLLGFQAMLPLFFLDDPGTRTVHAYLGTGIFGLFVVHAALGLQLALSL